MREKVSVIIPAYNEASVIGCCLNSLLPYINSGKVIEIIVVNDGSRDTTSDIARSFGVTVIETANLGAGGARNLGARSASGDLLWFVDADCVVDENALDVLLPHFRELNVVGVGGAYGNQLPGKLLPSLIHDEIAWRHLAMDGAVDFLASFNVIYRRDIFLEVGGFDTSFKKAQDAELAFRLTKEGRRLKFDRKSLVSHFHEDNFKVYLAVQFWQGFFRLMLYFRHPEKVTGDSYSSDIDFLQPVFCALALTVCLFWLSFFFTLVGLFGCLGLIFIAVILAYRIYNSFTVFRFWLFTPFYCFRAFSRTLGMIWFCIRNLRSSLSRGWRLFLSSVKA